MSASEAKRPLHRSRVALVWGLVSFTALEAMLAVVVNLWMPVLRDPVYALKRQRLSRQVAKPAMLVVTVGSSRMAFDLDAQRLGDSWGQRLGRRVVVFNFGILGGGALTELLTVHRLLREGIRPDALVVEVFPPFLAGQSGVATETPRFSPNQFQHEERALAQRFGVRGLRRSWKRSWLCPCYEHRLTILNWMMPVLLTKGARQDWPRNSDAAGWLSVSPAGRTLAERRQAAVRQSEAYAPYFNAFSLGGRNCEGLRQLLQLCRAEAIPVCLVLMPETTAFHQICPPRARRQIDAFVAALAGEFAARVIDARSWMPDEAFHDSQHLHGKGAVAFTERLGREGIPAPSLIGHRFSPRRQACGPASPSWCAGSAGCAH